MHCNYCSHKLERFLDISLSLDISPLTAFNANDCDAARAAVESVQTNDIIEHLDESTGQEVADTDREKLPTSTPPGKSRKAHHTGNDSDITLMQCLQHFTSQEILSELVHCERCKLHRPSRKKLSLSAAPKVLILHFKRFDSLRQLKICSKVNFPLRDLDLSTFMQPQINPHQNKFGMQNDNESNINCPESISTSGVTHTQRNQGIPIGTRNTHTQSSSSLLYDLQGLVSHRGSLTQVSKWIFLMILDISLRFSYFTRLILSYPGTLRFVCSCYE